MARQPNRQHGYGASAAVRIPLLVFDLCQFCMNVAVVAGQPIDPRKGAEMVSRTMPLLHVVAGAVGMFVTIESALAMLYSGL